MARKLVLPISVLLLLIVVGSVSAAQPWTVTITDPEGDVHAYTVQADTEAQALNLGWYRFKQQSIATAVPSSPPPTGSYPSLTEVDLDGDFDSGCQLVGSAQGAWDRLTPNDYPGEVAIERSRVAEGACSGKFTGLSSGRHRAELAWDGINDPTITYELLYYIPANTVPTEITQHKSGASCYNGGLRIKTRGVLELVAVRTCTSPQSNGQQHFVIGSYPEDAWFAVKVFWDHGEDGAVRAWLDPDGTGSEVYTERVPLTTTDTQSDFGSPVKFRAGTYGANPSVIWIDGYRADCLAAC